MKLKKCVVCPIYNNISLLVAYLIINWQNLSFLFLSFFYKSKIKKSFSHVTKSNFVDILSVKCYFSGRNWVCSGLL